MAELSNATLVLLLVTIFSYLLYRLQPPYAGGTVLSIILLVLISVISVIFWYRRIREISSQFTSIILGFIGGLILNELLSANYLAGFTKWLIETNTGGFDYISFFKSSLFISFIIISVFMVVFVATNPLNKSTNRIEKLILIFFGFSVVSLVLAGFNFITNLTSWLSLLPVAIHWGDKLTVDSNVIVDIIKSLFLAAFFNVLERITRMKKQI